MSGLDFVTFLFNLIISSTQEAEQADKEHIVENGTHTEETNAEGNLDDSTVMPFLLSLSNYALFLTLCLPFSFSIQYNLTVFLLSIPVNLKRLLIPFRPVCPVFTLTNLFAFCMVLVHNNTIR